MDRTPWVRWSDPRKCRHAFEVEPETVYELHAAAVATSHRGSGLADQMMEDLLERIRSRCPSPPDVIGLIHHGSDASKETCLRHNMSFDADDPDSDHVER